MQPEVLFGVEKQSDYEEWKSMILEKVMEIETA
jgi:hypothetical protein